MRYLIIFLLLISSAKAQIPAGVFNQDSRDLSKEIWITWGGISGEYEGVYVNSFSPLSTNIPPVTLKNAKGGDTAFSYRLDDPGNYNIYTQYHATGVLDIINRCEIQIERYDDGVEWFVAQAIALSSTVSTPVAVYVLGPRQASSQHNLSFSGWPLGSTVIPQNVSYPVQTKMEITSDWFEVGQKTAFSQAGITTPLNYQIGKIRAIAIKIL